MHRTYFGALERGEENPTLGTLFHIAKGFGMEASALIALAEQRLGT
jgi:hypothetical protein